MIANPSDTWLPLCWPTHHVQVDDRRKHENIISLQGRKSTNKCKTQFHLQNNTDQVQLISPLLMSTRNLIKKRKTSRLSIMRAWCLESWTRRLNILVLYPQMSLHWFVSCRKARLLNTAVQTMRYATAAVISSERIFGAEKFKLYCSHGATDDVSRPVIRTGLEWPPFRRLGKWEQLTFHGRQQDQVAAYLQWAWKDRRDLYRHVSIVQFFFKRNLSHQKHKSLSVGETERSRIFLNE